MALENLNNNDFIHIVSIFIIQKLIDLADDHT